MKKLTSEFISKPRRKKQTINCYFPYFIIIMAAVEPKNDCPHLEEFVTPLDINEYVILLFNFVVG